MSLQESSISERAALLNSMRGFLIVSLTDNFCELELERIETDLMARLAADQFLIGVLIDFGLVQTTDASDLQRLELLTRAIRLLGRTLVVSGITPGLAALIVQHGISLHHEVAGYDIDDALERFQSCAIGS